MRLVIAVGGNALLQRGETPDASVQLLHVRAAATALAPILNEHEVLLVHGNGPQVGLLALESEHDTTLTRPYPLDALGAQTQGMVGYWLGQALTNAGVTRPVVTVVSQAVVASDDPAFAHPDKLVGQVYTHKVALDRQEHQGWQIAQDGVGWRRVVASPAPRRIVEQAVIGQLLSGGTAVICGGGGGAPVISDGDQLHGVEAVVDKDWTAAILAIAVEADELLVLTDVEAVMRDFGTPHAVPLHDVALADIETSAFASGSMGPKVLACAHFRRTTGRPARIGALTDAARVLNGAAGTTVGGGQ